jgi:hypothetical protein
MHRLLKQDCIEASAPIVSFSGLLLRDGAKPAPQLCHQSLERRRERDRIAKQHSVNAKIAWSGVHEAVGVKAAEDADPAGVGLSLNEMLTMRTAHRQDTISTPGSSRSHATVELLEDRGWIARTPTASVPCMDHRRAWERSRGLRLADTARWKDAVQ